MMSDSESGYTTPEKIIGITIGVCAVGIVIVGLIYNYRIEAIGVEVIVCLALFRMIITDIREILKNF